MHLAGIHGEIETFEDFLAVDFDVQILDFKQCHSELQSLFFQPAAPANRCPSASAIHPRS